MMYRYVGLAAIVWLALDAGCVRTPTSGQNGGGTGAAAIVAKIVTSQAMPRQLAGQASNCPNVLVSVNGAPVSIQFDNDCAFVITGIQPATSVNVRVELVDLGVAGTIELSDVLDGELIEINIEPTNDSLTLSVERRTTPQPSDNLPQVISDDDISIQLSAGQFVQDLTVRGNNFTLVGEAGDGCGNANGWTVIEGDVLITGNNATFRNIMFSGKVELRGNNARFINSCFGGELVVFGNGTPEAPKLTCPTDLTVECDGSGNDAALAAWLAGASAESVCDSLTISNNFAALENDCGATGHATVTWTAHDDCGSDTCQATFSVIDTTVPTISGPGDLTFDCDESGTQTELVDWLDNANGADTCGDVVTTYQRDDVHFDCKATIVWSSKDECGNTSTHSAKLTIDGDTTAPVLTRNGVAALVLECGVEAYVEQGASVTDTCDATIVAVIGGDTVDDKTPGTYVVTYDATDLCGHAGTRETRTVTVKDTLAPNVTSRGRELWPPNHDLVTLTLADCARVVDACEGELDANVVGTIVSIYSDEPEDSNGDGNTTGDIELVDGHTFRVRSERQGGGNGRIYGVSLIVTDSAGNTSPGKCSISVPHDQSGSAAIDDGASAGYIVESN